MIHPGFSDTELQGMEKKRPPGYDHVTSCVFMVMYRSSTGLGTVRVGDTWRNKAMSFDRVELGWSDTNHSCQPSLTVLGMPTLRVRTSTQLKHHIWDTLQRGVTY
jgi:hypothetical protein